MSGNPVFIINPAAAHGRAGRPAVARRILERIPRAELLRTEGRGHATELAAVHADRRLIVAVGGDGTAHEVATGLLSAGGHAALGILAVGTGNDLARALGIPRGLAAGLAALDAGRPGRMDVLRVRLDDDERPIAVFNNLGIGFDAHASLLAVRYKALPGSLGYTAGILHALATWKGPVATVRVEDAQIELPLLFVTVSNGFSSGGGYLVTPDASPFDGLLDVCAVRRLNVARALRLMPSVRRGAHRSEREVTMLRGGRFEFNAQSPVPVHGDGEPLAGACRRVRVEIDAGALAVHAPQGHREGEPEYLRT